MRLVTELPEASRAVTTSVSVRRLLLAYRLFAAVVKPTRNVAAPARSVVTVLPPPIWRRPSRIRLVMRRRAREPCRLSVLGEVGRADPRRDFGAGDDQHRPTMAPSCLDRLGQGEAPSVRFLPCESSSTWLVYAGGFILKKRGCVPFDIEVGDRIERVRIAFGRSCPPVG